MDDEINFDFNSTDLPKLPEMKNWKKYAIIGGAIAAFAVLLIIIIILATYSRGSEGEKIKIGEILCEYEN